MLARRAIKAKKAIFVAVEGFADAAFFQLINGYCDLQGLSVYLKIENTKGSTYIAMLDKAKKKLDISENRSKKNPIFHEKFIFVDTDNFGKEGHLSKTEFMQIATSKKYGFKVGLQNPNIEGIFLRIFKELSHKEEFNGLDTEFELKKIWENYSKNITAQDIKAKILKDKINAQQILRHRIYNETFIEFFKIIGLEIYN